MRFVVLLFGSGRADGGQGGAATVRELLAALLARGNGAAFQRNAYRQSQNLPQVVRSAIAATIR
jgi:hypothetical protein